MKKSSMKFLRITTVLTVLSTCFLVSVSSHAQSDEQRLRRLENEIQTLSKAVFRNKVQTSSPAYVARSSSPSAAESAATSIRITQVENELRRLTGEIEQQNFKLRQLEERLNTFVYDQQQNLAANSIGATSPSSAHQMAQVSPASGTAAVQNRLRDQMQAQRNEALQAFGSHGQPATSPQHVFASGQGDNSAASSGGDQSQVLGSYTVNDSGLHTASTATGASAYYDQAFSFIRNRDYIRAEQAFRGFLDTYPAHELAPNAQYWLAETHYVRESYETAARLFAEAYKSAPSGGKAPDNLLKLGLSLASMGNKSDACIAFAQVKKQFSRGPTAILSRTDAEIERLSCE